MENGKWRRHIVANLLQGKLHIFVTNIEDEKATQDLSITGLERCQPASSH